LWVGISLRVVLAWGVVGTAAIKARFEALAPFLEERDRRLWAASEAYAAGRGGILAVSAVTSIARSTIEPGLLEALAELVQSATRGDPEAALLWVSRSQRCLARALAERGFSASQKLIGSRQVRLAGKPA